MDKRKKVATLRRIYYAILFKECSKSVFRVHTGKYE